MANNKHIISVVAATVLAASFTMTGCGSSSSSSDDNTSSSSSEITSSSSSTSSVAPAVTSVRVSDAYVVEANVTVGTVPAVIYAGEGVYEFNTTVEGPIVSKGGVNDMNNNGVADNGEPYAPDMAAPAGYTNVNPFTTKLVNGETDLTTMYPVAAATPGDNNLTWNFDAVAKAAENIDLAKEVAKAALSVSGYPGDGNVSSSSTSSEESSSSEAASSSEANDSPFPAVARTDSPFPETPTSSSSEAVSSSEEASSSSSESGTGSAFAEIDNCLDVACINSVVQAYMGALNGVYEDGMSSSSEDMSSSEAVSSSEAASSSEANDSPFPAPAL